MDPARVEILQENGRPSLGWHQRSHDESGRATYPSSRSVGEEAMLIQQSWICPTTRPAPFRLFNPDWEVPYTELLQCASHGTPVVKYSHAQHQSITLSSLSRASGWASRHGWAPPSCRCAVHARCCLGSVHLSPLLSLQGSPLHRTVPSTHHRFTHTHFHTFCHPRATTALPPCRCPPIKLLQPDGCPTLTMPSSPSSSGANQRGLSGTTPTYRYFGLLGCSLNP